MNPTLTQKLIEEYPELYYDYKKPLTESLMCFGFECGDGWYDLINILSMNIKSYIDMQIEHEILMRGLLVSWRKIFVGWKTGWKSKGWYKRVWANIKRYGVPVDIDSMQVRASQVKEKYGGLRFYVHNSDDYVLGMIHMAEEMSYRICEVCGKTGSLYKHAGWYKTVCEECAEPLGYKKASDKNDS
jgi:hypothetical protein